MYAIKTTALVYLLLCFQVCQLCHFGHNHDGHVFCQFLHYAVQLSLYTRGYWPMFTFMSSNTPSYSTDFLLLQLLVDHRAYVHLEFCWTCSLHIAGNSSKFIHSLIFLKSVIRVKFQDWG